MSFMVMEDVLGMGLSALKSLKIVVVVLSLLIICLLWASKARKSKALASVAPPPPIIEARGSPWRWWHVVPPRSTSAAAVARDGRKAWSALVKQADGRPFRLAGLGGLVTVLPPAYADEIGGDDRLDAEPAMARLIDTSIPGFEGFRAGLEGAPVVRNMCRDNLTKDLATIVEPLPDEARLALEEALDLPEPGTAGGQEWQQIGIKRSLSSVVARVSTRVLLGKELCRNAVWLEIAAGYHECGVDAARSLRTFPSLVWPLIHWFLPACRKLRSQVRQARQLIYPVIRRRQQQREACLSRGEKAVMYHDAIEWAEVYRDGQAFDPVELQLGVAATAVYKMTDLLCQVVYDLASDPDLVRRVRKEVVDVVGTEGWSKFSLDNLRLLDSVIKESQRIKPLRTVEMPRKTTSKIFLSDGTPLPRGTIIGVSAERHWQSSVYPEPHRFIGDRFLKARQLPGQESRSQLVSTSPDHLGFGHGIHACPGRHVAAAALKMILVHLVLGYEWTAVGGQAPEIPCQGVDLEADPRAEILLRRRHREL